MIEGRPQRVSAGRWSLGRTLLLWYGALGSAAAWALELVLGYGFEEAGCSPGSSHWGLPTGTAELAVFLGTAAFGAGSVAAAAATHRAARRPDSGDVRGRLEFMGLAGLAAGVLFMSLIVMTGFGITSLSPCKHG